ncbi:MAG: hypothetical protein ACI87E_004016 [Mariniblastus sp.]|jgi:hypothetical protein
MKSKPRPKRGTVDPEIDKATQVELTPVLLDMGEVHRLLSHKENWLFNKSLRTSYPEN